MQDNLTIDNFVKKICAWFNKDRRILFFTIFIIGMLVHFQLYNNELLAYDAYWHYGSFLAKGWEVSLGRFFIPFIDLLRGTLVSSTLTSIIAISTMSFTVLILCDLFNIKKTYIKVLLGILLVVTPTFSLTLMYPYTADSYTFAMLFAVLSVYFMNKCFNFKNVCLSIICIVITLGFYQAYLCVIITLCAMIYLINSCTQSNVTFKEIIKKIAFDILILFIGIIAYYICYVIILKLLNLDMTNYNGGNKILSIETFKNLLPAIKNTYITFYQFHFQNNIIENTEFVYRNIVNIFMFLLIFINFVILIINNKVYKNPYKLALIILVLMLFPVFTCVIQLIAQERAIDLLMSSALYFPLVLLLKQVELVKATKFNNIINILSVLVLSLSIWTFILTDNATYVATNLYNKQMSSLGNRIIMKIQDSEEISADLPICIIGKMDFNIQNPRLLNLTNFDVSNINIWTWQIFFQDNLAIGRDICSFETYENIYNNEECWNMNIFPYENSIKIIDGTIVVKIGY